MVPYDPWVAAAVAAACFATALLSAIAGFGGGALLLPVFVAVFGARDAVAVLTVAQLASNGSRVWFNRGQIDRRLVAIFAAGAVPAAVAGAVLLSRAPVTALTRVIGVFLLAIVMWRRIRPAAARVGDPGFAVIGAASGFGSALVGSVEPMVAPFFLARGLMSVFPDKAGATKVDRPEDIEVSKLTGKVYTSP